MPTKKDYNPFNLKEKPIRGCPGYVMLENMMVFDTRTGKQRIPFFTGTTMKVYLKNQQVFNVLELHTKLFGSKRKNYKGHFYRELKRFEELEIVEMNLMGASFEEIRKRFSIYNPKIEAVLAKYKHIQPFSEQDIFKKLAQLQHENQENRENKGGQSTGHDQ